MSLNSIIQFWRLLMEHKKIFEALKALGDQPCVRLIPVYEEEQLFVIRKTEVQIILTDLFMKLHKRGRPKKDKSEENTHAA